jgi:hypothetical protein
MPERFCRSKLCRNHGRCIVDGMSASVVENNRLYKNLYANCPLKPQLRTPSALPIVENCDERTEENGEVDRLVGLGEFVSWVQDQKEVSGELPIEKLASYTEYKLPNSPSLQELLLKAILIRDRFPKNIKKRALRDELVCRLNRWVGCEGLFTQKVKPDDDEYISFLETYLATVREWNPKEYKGEEGDKICELTFFGDSVEVYDLIKHKFSQGCSKRHEGVSAAYEQYFRQVLGGKEEEVMGVAYEVSHIVRRTLQMEEESVAQQIGEIPGAEELESGKMLLIIFMALQFCRRPKDRGFFTAPILTRMYGKSRSISELVFAGRGQSDQA